MSAKNDNLYKNRKIFQVEDVSANFWGSSYPVYTLSAYSVYIPNDMYTGHGCIQYKVCTQYVQGIGQYPCRVRVATDG
jgi:hypothetical protein